MKIGPVDVEIIGLAAISKNVFLNNSKTAGGLINQQQVSSQPSNLISLSVNETIDDGVSACSGISWTIGPYASYSSFSDHSARL